VPGPAQGHEPGQAELFWAKPSRALMAAHQWLRPGPRKHKAGAGSSDQGFSADNFGKSATSSNSDKHKETVSLQDFGVFSLFLFLFFTNFFLSIT
jgi:hypothetical protein